jgi:Domain of unknown function (DUF4282)
MTEQRGLFAELFDFSFRSFITVRLIKILYIVTVVIFGLIALGILITAFAVMNFSGTTGFLYLVSSPLVFLFGVVQSRVFLEVALILFRIESNTAALVNKGP